MNTPDTRPIGVLTQEILATASHWCLIRTNPMYALVYPTERMHAGYAQVATMDGFWFGSPNDACYPCTLQPNGLILPEPWPVLDGEDEIEEWFKYHHDRRPACSKITDIYTDPRMWVLLHADGKRAITAKAMPERPGFHPAPRRDSEGFTVWVWEKDRC